MRQGSGCDLGFPIGFGPAKTLGDMSGFWVRIGFSHRIWACQDCRKYVRDLGASWIFPFGPAKTVKSYGKWEKIHTQVAP